METFEIPHFTRRGGELLNLRIPVRWQRREYGGWNLVHHETGRVLGWIVRNTEQPRLWDCRINPGAFRGDQTDEGDVMDRVPARLYYGDPDNAFTVYRFIDAKDRWQAAYPILCHLIRHRAPALGFAAHPDVQIWKYSTKRQLVAA